MEGRKGAKARGGNHEMNDLRGPPRLKGKKAAFLWRKTCYSCGSRWKIERERRARGIESTARDQEPKNGTSFPRWRGAKIPERLGVARFVGGTFRIGNDGWRPGRGR